VTERETTEGADAAGRAPGGAGATEPVVIVGGGLAGLACAARLTEAGQPVRVLEASDGVGGRVRTDEVDGFRLDRGFQVLLTAYPDVRRTLDAGALDLRPFWPGSVVRFRGKFHVLGDPFRRPLDLLPTVFNPIGSLADKLRTARLRLELAKLDVEACLAGDDVPTASWLRQRGFSEAFVDRFFRPFLGGVFLDRELSSSSRMFRFVFRNFAAGDTCVPAKGMGRIPDQLAGRLPEGSVRVGAHVVHVEPRGVTLEGGEAIAARRVVVAVDAATASRWIAGLPERHWNGVTCLYFEAPAPPARGARLVLNGDGTGPVHNLAVMSEVSADYAPAGRALVSVSCLGVPDDEERLRSEVMDQLEDWYGPPSAAWRHLRTYRIPRALPSQPPGALEPPRRPVTTADGLFVCGDHLETSSLQGAMACGRRAAEAVLADLGARS